MLKVLFLTLSAHDYPAAGGRTRIVSQARFVGREFAQVHILCLVPLRKYFYPAKLNRARKSLIKDSLVKVTHFPMIVTFGISWLEKVALILNSAIVAIFARYNQFGIIHAHGTGASEIALGVKDISKKVKVVADIHGIVSEEIAFSEGIGMDHPKAHKLLKKECEVFRKADRLIVVSERMIKYIKNFVKEASPSVVVPCATVEHEMMTPELREQRRCSLGLNGRIVFLYLGSYRAYQMATETIKFFSQLKYRIPDAYLVILTSHIKEFSAELSKYKISKHDYLIKTVSMNKVFDYIQLADIGLMLRGDSQVNIVASPTKFAEYLIAGLPVLTTPYAGDYSKMVKQNRLGYILEKPLVDDSLIEFINDFRQNREAYRKRANLFCKERLTWEAVGQRIKEAYLD